MSDKLGVGIMESFDPELKRAFENADQSVDPKLVDYSKVKIKKDSILLSGDGTFYTLQGEGPTMGLPCVFVRLHVCNLRCVWCDAFYTWDARSEEFWTESKRFSFEQCAQKIIDSWDSRNTQSAKRVIFTGGEPLIQKTQIDAVCDFLWKENPNWEFEIETNGTLMPTPMQLQTFQFNCSPKLSNSDNQHHSMVKPKILSRLNEANSSFKFVCTSESDLDEIEKNYLPHIDFDKVIIMPQGVTDEEVNHNAQMLAEYVKEKGFRMLGRLQNQIWGAKRGV